MLLLPGQDIISGSTTSMCARIIYNDRWFWIQKIDNDHGTQDAYPSDYISKYGHPDSRGINIYMRWSAGINDILRNKYNDIIIWRIEKYKYKYDLGDALDSACAFDNLELLKYGWSKQVLPSEFGVERAVVKGYLELIQWLNTVGTAIDIDHANFAAANGHLHLIQWFETKHILPNKKGANWAAASGYLHILHWLDIRNVIPNTDGANASAEKGLLDVLQWLETKNVYPTIRGVNQAALHGLLHILKWLGTRNILPDVNGANHTASQGHLHVLLWLETKNILPTEQGANRAYRNEHKDVLRWLKTKNIYPVPDDSD